MTLPHQSNVAAGLSLTETAAEDPAAFELYGGAIVSASREFRQKTEAPAKREEKEAPIETALLEAMMSDILAGDLEDIEGPSAAELAALEAEDESLSEVIESPLSPAELAALAALEVEDAPLTDAIQPPLSLRNSLEEPELVSLEGLDDVIETIEEDLLEEDDLLDDLLDNYADLDLDDDDIEDEGYDLDDDDIDHYQDLYGEDGDIIPSFREGETDDEDERDIAYYDDLR